MFYHTTKKKIGLVGVTLVIVIASYFFILQNIYSKVSPISIFSPDLGTLVGQTPSGQTIYIAALKNPENRGGGDTMQGSDLTVLDSKTNTKRVIAQNIWTAQFSATNDQIVTADSQNKVRIYSLDGSKKTEIGVNGSNPIFTYDGKYVVYQKLADKGENYFELASNAKGLASYDISTGEEKVLTKNSGDDWPIGFSADMKYFYFNASRPYEHSVFGITNIESGLYSLNVSTGVVTRLTNADEQKTREKGPTMSFISHNALWTSDRLKVITDVGNSGIYEYIFDGNGGLKSVERLSDGYSPAWAVTDKSVEVHSKVDGKESTSIINIK